MKLNIKLIAALLITLTIFSYCSKNNSIDRYSLQHEINYFNKSITNFPETFESGTKTSYTAANITLASGSWNFNDAVIGTSTSDRKSGTKSARIQNTGIITMNFDITAGVSSVSFNYAKYGSESNSTFELWSSINSGSTWQKMGTTLTA